MKNSNKKGKLTYKLKSSILILSIIISGVYFPPVKASKIDCNDPRLSMNDIQFWNPCSVECDAFGGNGSATMGKNKDYKGDSVFNEAQMTAIKEYMPVYQEAAVKANVPWQVIAVMHARENGLSLEYNKNAQGIFQDYEGAGHYPAGGNATSEAFLSEAVHAGEKLKGKVPGKEEKLASGDADTVKDAFFGYNGRADVYKQQALALGFDQEGADRGEGSPYVMNKADDKRDPNTNPSGWGQIKTDGGSITYPANEDYGAFVMYAALTNGVQTSSNCASNLGSITEGGLTEEQAKKLVINYGKNPNNYASNATGEALWGLCHGGGSNCVTFSAFFLSSFTELTAPGGVWGNGGQVVDRQSAQGVESGTEPRPFAVFGHSDGVTICEDGLPCGHTGIVLGIHGDTIIVGHASCDRGRNGKRGSGDGTQSGSGSAYIVVSKLNTLADAFNSTTNLRFAYPKNVNVDEINKFINM